MPRVRNSHSSLCHSPFENYYLNLVQIHLLPFNSLEMESNSTVLFPWLLCSILCLWGPSILLHMVCIFIPVTVCISLLEYNTMYFTILLLMDFWDGFNFWLLQILWLLKSFSECLHTSSAYIHRRWLAHMICKCSAFVDTATEFSKWPQHFTLPPVVSESFSCSVFSPTLGIAVPFSILSLGLHSSPVSHYETVFRFLLHPLILQPRHPRLSSITHCTK